MEWRDTGILLSVRRHGETSAIIDVFTPDRGRHAGVVRGGTSRKIAPILQPGALLDVTWKARLEEHLGAYTVEPVRSRAAHVMSEQITLAGLNAACALLTFALPEREAMAAFHDQSEALFDMIGTNPAWTLAYLRWELTLLDALGFGLDLSTCASTGATDDLIYVSPRTGRAVSRNGAGQWADKLLPLPPSLLGEGQGAASDLLAGLRTTGHFLTNRLAPALGDRPVPPARQRLVDLIARQG